MPNNASARRVKDKKNNDKKGEGSKKTDTLSLPKKDAASVDSSTLSLSSAGKDKSSKSGADGSSLSVSVVGKEQAGQGACLALYKRVLKRPGPQDIIRFLHRIKSDVAEHAEDEDDSWADALRFEYTLANDSDERMSGNREFRAKCREDNQLISKEELKAILRRELMRNMLKWRAGVLQGEKDFLLSAALSERIKEDELLVEGPAQKALLKEYALSRTEEERVNTYAEVREANPKAGAKELAKILKAANVQAALAWHKSKVQEENTSSLPRSEMTSHLKLSRSLTRPRLGGTIYLSLLKRGYL
jgi:hypothetical protein